MSARDIAPCAASATDRLAAIDFDTRVAERCSSNHHDGAKP
jgi:hypothetical protein